MRVIVAIVACVTIALAWGEEGAGFQASFEGQRPQGVQAVDGIEGKGVLLGGSGDGRKWMEYPAAGNISPDAGTVEMWLKPQGWSGKDDGFEFFFTWAKPGNVGLQIYKYWEAPATIRFLVGRTSADKAKTDMVSAWSYINAWKDGEWHHIAATWRRGADLVGQEGRVRLYLDGVLAQEQVLDRGFWPEGFPETFYVGNHNDWGHPVPGETAYDEVRIYPRELAAEEIRARYLSLHRQEVSKPVFAAAWMPQRPKGGKGNIPGEWSRASSYTGFLDARGNLSAEMKQPLVAVGYDHENLYVMIADNQGYEPKATAEGRDSPVYMDDAYELFLAPKEGGEYYQIVINSKGAVYDGKGMDGTWNGAFESAARIGAEGQWVTEIAVPWKTLGMEAPKPGQTMGFNLCRDIMHNGRQFASLAPVGGNFHDVAHFARLTFLAKGERIAELLKGDPRDGHLDLAVQAPGMKAEAELTSEGRELQRAEGEAARLQYKFEGVQQARDAMIRARVRRGEEVVYSQDLPFTLTPLVTVASEMAPDSDEMTVRLTPAESIAGRLKGGKVTLQFVGEDGRKLLDVAGAWTTEMKVDAAKLPAGRCIVKVAIADAEGKAVWAGEAPLYVPKSDQWRDYRGGLDPNEVPAPWTPVKYEGRTLKWWNRTCGFGRGALPTSITSGGSELLRGPIALTAEVDGKACVVDAGALKATKTARGKVELAGAGTFAGGDVSAKVSSEFDGYTVWHVEIALKPGAKLTQLHLDLPMRADVAKLQYIPFLNEGEMPGKDDVGAIQAHRALGFLPGVWIGNDDVGLTWFAESDEFWYPADPKRAIEIVGGATPKLRMNFVEGANEKLPRKLVYEFGLQATPVKPFPEPHDWLGYSFVEASNEKLFVTGWGNDPATWWQGFPAFPSEKGRKASEGETADLHSSTNRYGRPLLTERYLTATMCVENVPELGVFKRYWAVHPADIWGTDGPVPMPFVRMCPNSRSWDNCFCYNFDKLMGEIPENGYYQDFGHPKSCDNETHGCGYVRDGKRHPTYPIFGQHELNKRLYILAKHHEAAGRRIFLVGHSGGTYPLPHGNFWDMVVDGEYLGGVMASARSYMDFLSDERVRAECSGRQFGIMFDFIPNRIGSKTPEEEKAYTDELMAVLATNGVVWSWHAFIDREPQARVLAAYERFGTSGIERFLPYWKNGDVAKCATPDVKATLYVKAGKVLVALGNRGREEREAEVAIDLAKLGLGITVTAIDACTGGAGPTIEGGRLRVKVPARGFAMVLIEGRNL